MGTWTITDWLNWFASAPPEEHRALIDYGTAVLNSDGTQQVPVPALSKPRTNQHDRGQGNVDIRAGKPQAVWSDGRNWQL